jgi:NADH-quinone oxidoreductase subunit A
MRCGPASVCVRSAVTGKQSGCHVSLAQSDFATVAWLIVVATALTLTILLLTHLIGPQRAGPTKDAIYESGMEPFTDARRRFSVRFYLIAVLFLIFDVEVVFLYPWAVLYPRWHSDEHRGWVQALLAAGYTPAYLLLAIGVFLALLLVGFIYEWRRGVFKWN